MKNNMTDRMKFSMLRVQHSAKEPSIIQHDGYNCGVICLAHFIQMYRNENEFETLEKEEQKAALLRLRLNILSMIRAVYELLNDKLYQIISDHIYFDIDSGTLDSDKDLKKWKDIHKLFNVGKYPYLRDSRNTLINANLIFKNKTHEAIQTEITCNNIIFTFSSYCSPINISINT